MDAEVRLLSIGRPAPGEYALSLEIDGRRCECGAYVTYPPELPVAVIKFNTAFEREFGATPGTGPKHEVFMAVLNAVRRLAYGQSLDVPQNLVPPGEE